MPELIENPQRLVKMVVTSTAVVMALFLPINFFVTYAFNDRPSWDDHWTFLLRTIVAVLALSGLFSVVLLYQGRSPLARSAMGALLVTTTVPLAIGVVYTLLNLLPELDSAVGSGASSLQCLVIASAFAAAGSFTAILGIRMLD